MNSLTNLDLTQPWGPRELYKNKNIKQYISLASEDIEGVKVSGETCLLARRQASEPQATSFEETPERGTMCQERSGNVISPRELYAPWTGISVHHVRTARGVRIGITLQQAAWQAQARTLQITAELKRYDRLREVRALEDDSPEFSHYITGIKNMLHQEQDRRACLGRAHQRGARRAWIHDTLVLAYLDSDQVRRVLLHIEGQDMIIDMNHSQSDLQNRVYHATGVWGRLVLRSRSPRIADLPTHCHA